MTCRKYEDYMLLRLEGARFNVDGRTHGAQVSGSSEAAACISLNKCSYKT
jgi:hypothetical protein